MRFSKFSVGSIFSNWLYSSEHKAPKIVKSFKTLNFLCQALKVPSYIYQKNVSFPIRAKWTNIFQLICHKFFFCFLLIKSLTGLSFSDFKADSSPVICLLMKWDFLSFLLFPYFGIGSIAQNEKPEVPEIFKFLKSLNFLYQSYKTST